ncbi:MAG: hypothetical protein HUK21_05735 [Fibrobacteraceae bacterium]|nr:hypothetical protein [Fibrobacteraceae bacterium]
MKKIIVVATILAYANISFAARCNGESYVEGRQICIDGDIYDYCGDKTVFNRKYEFCDQGKAYKRCGVYEYDVKKEFCNDQGQVKKLCNGKTYSSDKFCYSQMLFSLCGERKYDPLKEYCYNNVVVQKSSWMRDGRDSRVYKTVRIGNMRWLAENLDYEVPNQKDLDSLWCLNSDCNKLGRLYNWTSAMGVGIKYIDTELGDVKQSICPENWHLPSDEEWEKMDEIVKSMYPDVNLKIRPQWISNFMDGTDTLGLSMVPVNVRFNGEFLSRGSACFWTMEETAKDGAAVWCYEQKTGEIKKKNYYKKAGLSVRCVEDSK